jgi:hypothetical protein
MSLEAVNGYIRHRLQVAGLRGDRVLFAPDIIETLHRRSGGVPRLINRVCDRSLQLAYAKRAKAVDRETLETALLEIGSTTLSPTWDAIIADSQPSAAVAATGTASVAAAAPAEAPEPAATVTTPDAPVPPVSDDKNFDTQIDHWFESELAPASKRRPSSALPADAPVRRTPAPAAAQSRPMFQSTSEWRRDDRLETYIGKLLRKWATRAAIAAVVFLFINLALALGSMLLAIQEPATLPAYPVAPPKPLPSVIATVTPDEPASSQRPVANSQK